MDHVEEVNADSLAEFFVFGGDMCRASKDSFFDAFDRDKALIHLPQYLVPGNHDIDFSQSIPEFDLRYMPGPNLRYQHWNFGKNHFFILDPHLDGWNISGAQQDWLEANLATVSDADNLFFFSHELLWWDPDTLDEWNLPVPNSDWLRDSTVNFWTEIIPLLRATKKPCYWISGDMGATCHRATRFFANPYPLIRLVGSGMGCHEWSGYLEVRVFGPGQVIFIENGIGSQNMGLRDTLSPDDRFATPYSP